MLGSVFTFEHLEHFIVYFDFGFFSGHGDVGVVFHVFLLFVVPEPEIRMKKSAAKQPERDDFSFQRPDRARGSAFIYFSAGSARAASVHEADLPGGIKQKKGPEPRSPASFRPPLVLRNTTLYCGYYN